MVPCGHEEYLLHVRNNVDELSRHCVESSSRTNGDLLFEEWKGEYFSGSMMSRLFAVREIVMASSGLL